MNEDEVYFQVDPHKMTYITRILEGYEYLGVITTVDAAKGIARVRSVADTKEVVKTVLLSLPLSVKLISDWPT